VILIDTSAWIAYFKDEPGADHVQAVIERERIATCEPILFELIPSLRLKKQDVLCDLVRLSAMIRMTPDWNWIQDSQTNRAIKGKRLLGLADWLILDTARQSNVPLLTLDKALADAAIDSKVALA
jgi:predicted nucleic acid-binding protein